MVGIFKNSGHTGQILHGHWECFTKQKYPPAKDIRKLVEPIIKHRLGFPSNL
jgi:hypothetical protein